MITRHSLHPDILPELEYRSLQVQTISEGKEVFIASVLATLEYDHSQWKKGRYDLIADLSIAGLRAAKILASRGQVIIYSVRGECRIIAKKWCD